MVWVPRDKVLIAEHLRHQAVVAPRGRPGLSAADSAGDQNFIEPRGRSVRDGGLATTVTVVKQIRRDEWWRFPMQGLQQISQISKSLTQCSIDFLRRGSGDITINEIPPIDYHVERQ